MASELKPSQQDEPIVTRVTQPAETKMASESARKLASALGFSSTECEEIALAVTELASNLIRHASGGTISVSALITPGRTGIQIESDDSGPGIADVERAITDGFSTAGGLGIGLGAVNRLVDDLEFVSKSTAGLHVVCQRWLRPKSQGLFTGDLSFGVASRPCRMAPQNGDAFVIKRWDAQALAGLIDGLGHGEFAQRAARTARQYLEQHFDQPLDSLFRGVGRACRATRGVVMALARFDLARHKLTVANVGNVEMRLVGGTERFNPIVRRGIVGLNAPNAVPTEHVWPPAAVLIMQTDGLKTHWDWNEFRHLESMPPGVIADRLLTVLGKPDDDATVIVARDTKS